MGIIFGQVQTAWDAVVTCVADLQKKARDLNVWCKVVQCEYRFTVAWYMFLVDNHNTLKKKFAGSGACNGEMGQRAVNALVGIDATLYISHTRAEPPHAHVWDILFNKKRPITAQLRKCSQNGADRLLQAVLNADKDFFLSLQGSLLLQKSLGMSADSSQKASNGY